MRKFVFGNIYFFFAFILFVNIAFCQTLKDKEIDSLYSYISKYQKKIINPFIYVDIKKQKMFLIDDKKVINEYMVSTGINGSRFGAVAGSNQTPLGLFKIDSKIGDGAKIGEIFRGKRSMQKLAKIYKKGDNYPKDIKDEILTRVLVLDGMEKGINKGRDKNNKLVDAYFRGILIHGTNNESGIGKEISHGCIRMLNEDVIKLYDLVKKGTLVLIK